APAPWSWAPWPARRASSAIGSAAYGVSQPGRSRLPPDSPPGGNACPHAQRRLRRSRLGRAARADEEAGGLDEVAAGAHPIEDALGHHDHELRLERHRQLDEIERIGGQIVTQRDAGDERFQASDPLTGD